MDINKLIEFYDKEQKLLFTSFCVTIPLSFSILYLYIPEFKLLDIYIQSIFSATLSIIAITISFTAILFGIFISRVERTIRLYTTILPAIFTTMISCIAKYYFNTGIWFPIILYFFSSASLILSFLLFSYTIKLTHIKNEHSAKSNHSTR